MPLTQFRIDVPALAPPHMRGPNLNTLFGAHGAALDQTAEQAMFGRLQAIPYAGGPNAARDGAARLADGRLIECEPFALALHSAQRGIPLYDTESTLSKRIRLAMAPELHRRRGTQLGELQHVRPYFSGAPFTGYPILRAVHQTGSGIAVWHTISPTDPGGNVVDGGVYSIHRASNFNYDGQTTKRSRVWFFVYMTGTGATPPITYGSGHTYGDGSVYGSGGSNPITAAMAADIAKMFRGWTGAHEWCAGVALVWNPNAVNPTGAPTQDADGRWSLPNGPNTWSVLVDPGTGKATRPLGVQWIYDSPAP